jgi:uncharacterized membrane protein YhaH (DUF805 family)
MNQPPPPSPYAQLLFYFIILLPFIILIYRMAKRKGKSGWLAIWGAVPVLNMFVALWIASLPEAKLVQEIQELKNRLNLPPGS